MKKLISMSVGIVMVATTSVAQARIPVIDWWANSTLNQILDEVEKMNERLVMLTQATERMVEAIGTGQVGGGWKLSKEERPQIKDERSDEMVEGDCPRQPEEWGSYDEVREWGIKCFFILAEGGKGERSADRLIDKEHERQQYLKSRVLSVWAYAAHARGHYKEQQDAGNKTLQRLQGSSTLRADVAVMTRALIDDMLAANEIARVNGQMLEIEAMEAMFARNPILEEGDFGTE